MSAATILFAAGLVAGILSAYADLRASALGAAALAIAAAAAFVALRQRPRVRAWIATIAVFLAGGIAGEVLGARHYASFPADHVRGLVEADRQPAVLEGVVVDDPATRSFQYLRWTSMRVEAEAVTIHGVRRPASGRVATFVWWDEPPPVAYGARVRLTGEIARPEPPLNPGEADRRVAYAHERIYAVFSVPKDGAVDVLDATAGSPLVAAISGLKQRLRASLRAAAPGDAGIFLESILLGRREALDEAVVDDFVRTNTIHVLAVSGLHLAVLWSVLWVILTRLLRVPAKPAILVVLGFALAHCAITGASPSILRATIMVAIVAVGRLVAREPRTLNSLAIAAVAILVHNPGDVMSVGFQLSFAAIIGIDLLFRPMKATFMSCFPPLGARAGWRRRATFFAAWMLGDAVLVALAAWLATGPLILWHYHLVSPGTIPANLAVALPVWVVLSAGMVALCIAPVSTVAAKPFVWVAGLGSSLLVKIVRGIAAVPGVYFYLPDVRGGQVVASYCALGALAWAGARGWRPRWLVVAAPVAAVLVLVPARPADVQADEAHVAVLSVGKGETTVVRTRGATVLFDCGSGKIIDPGARIVAPYLWSQGVRSIDAIFISHAHDDHENAVLAIADRFPIGRVYVNPGFADLGGGRRMLEELRSRSIPVRALVAGEAPAAIAGIDVRVLAPLGGALAEARDRPAPAPRDAETREREERKDDQNDKSLVLSVRVGGRSVLFPGDLEDAGADALFDSSARNALDADLFLVPHHGSKNRHTVDFAQRVRARLAIASTRARFAPAQTFHAYEAAGTPVVETWASGCVEVDLGPRTFRARAFAGGLPAIPAERPPGPPVVFPSIAAPPVERMAAPTEDAGIATAAAPPPRRRRRAHPSRLESREDEPRPPRTRARRADSALEPAKPTPAGPGGAGPRVEEAASPVRPRAP